MGSEKEILKTGDQLKAVESKKEFDQKSNKITNQINELKNSTVDTDLSFLDQKVSPVVDSGQQNITTDEEKNITGSTSRNFKRDRGKYKQSVDKINAGDGDPTNKVNKIDNLFANKVLTAYGITRSEEEAEEKSLKDKVKEYTALVVREVLGDDAATEKTLGGLNLAMFGFAMAKRKVLML